MVLKKLARPYNFALDWYWCKDWLESKVGYLSRVLSMENTLVSMADMV